MFWYKSNTFCAIFAQILIIFELFSICFAYGSLIHYDIKSYYIETSYKTDLLNAHRFCKSHGMELLTIESSDENKFLYRQIIDQVGRSGGFWTSAARLQVGSEFISLGTGKIMTYFNWVPGKPNNYNEHQQCIAIEQNSPANGGDPEFKMDDVSCNSKKYFICEFKWTKDCIKNVDLSHVGQDKSTGTNGPIDVRSILGL